MNFFQLSKQSVLTCTKTIARDYGLSLWLIFITVLVGVWLQSQLFFNNDVSWLVHIAKKMLAGGKYYRDFFEFNPPMAIYIYFPAAWLSKVLQVNSIISALIMVITCAIFSLLFCMVILRQLLANNQQFLLVMVFISFVFMLLPADQFGQREHLTVMLVLPYLFLTVANASGKKFSRFFSILIGVSAGVGFNIKPYFLLGWLALEGYLAITNYSYWRSCRLETWLVLVTTLLYVVSIIVLTPEYLTEVLPIIVRFYHFSFSEPILTLFTYPLAAWVVVAIIVGLVFRTQHSQSLLVDVLLISAVAFFIVHLYQGMHWYYHLYPAVAFATLLLVVLGLGYGEKIIIFMTAALILIVVSLTFLKLAQNMQERKFSYRNQLVSFLKTQPQVHTINFFTVFTLPTFPLVDYAQVNYTSRFSCFKMLLGIQRYLQLPLTAVQRLQALQAKQYFIQAVTEDFEKSQPDLVFVQADTPQLRPVWINFIEIFSTEPRFQQLWHSYHYLGRQGNYEVYTKF